MITLLNTSIITAHGQYSFSPFSLEEAKRLIAEAGDDIQSAIGHQATADILTELLGIPVAVNRIEYRQQVGDQAIVFKLRGRAPEGVILNREEVEKVGYDFGLLERRG